MFKPLLSHSKRRGQENHSPREFPPAGSGETSKRLLALRVLITAPQGQFLEKGPLTVCSGTFRMRRYLMVLVIKMLERKHWRVITALVIPTRVGSEPAPSQWLGLCIGPCWPQPQGWRPLSKAVVSKKGGVCPGGCVEHSLGVKEDENFYLRIFKSKNEKKNPAFLVFNTQIDTDTPHQPTAHRSEGQV